MSTVATTSVTSALLQPFEGQCWILPDNSLVLLMNAGSISFSGANTNHTLVLQSTDWQNASPTWSFVQRISTVSNELASSYWDGTRLHVAYANATPSNTSGLFYISATYASSTWTWDSSPTTLIAASDPTNNASSPCVLADSRGVVYVAYRNQAVAAPNTTSVCMFTKGLGGWNSTPVQVSATSGTSSLYYGAMSYSNNRVILVTCENTSYYAQVHPDGGSWGSAALGPTSQTASGQQYGPVTVIADANSGAWVGISTTAGMKATHLTWSGSSVTWSGVVTTLDSAANVSAPEWLYCSNTLYGYYFKTTSTGNADVYTIQYSAGSNSWSSATNLTNALTNNNIGPVVPANYTYSNAVPVMPYIWQTGTASPYTINLATLAPISQPGLRLFAARLRLQKLLPGQTLTNNVSNFIFGSNLGQPVTPTTVYNTSAIQQKIKAGNFQVMRTSFQPTATHADMDNHYNAIIDCGCVPLITLNMLSTLAQNSDLVTYMGSRCLLYEVGNEPDGAAGGGPFTAAQYYTYWSTNVPTLRGINPNAAFIGPTVTHEGYVTGATPGTRGAFIADWLTSCQSVGGSMLPDAISFHDYPCNGLANTPANQLVCASRATRFGTDYTTVDGIVNSILGYSLPLCLTEWNVPGVAWGLDSTFVTPWVHTAIDSMVQAGYAMANQFEAGSGEGNPTGSGSLDLVIAISPYTPGLDYQPIVDKNIQYLQHAAPGILLTVNRRSGTGLTATNRRSGTGTSVSRRNGVGLSTTSRRNGSGVGSLNRRNGTGVSISRRG